MARWHGNADLRSAPLREAQRNRGSPTSWMTHVPARTPAEKDGAHARERRPPVGTAAQSAAKPRFAHFLDDARLGTYPSGGRMARTQDQASDCASW